MEKNGTWTKLSSNQLNFSSMEMEQKEIIKSTLSRDNFFAVIKSMALAAIIVIGVLIILFWGVAFGRQFSERRILINNSVNTAFNSEKKYLCSVNGKKLCTRMELIEENIYMAKLAVYNYFYFSYYPQSGFQNFAAVALNLLIVIKIFSKMKKNKKILL